MTTQQTCKQRGKSEYKSECKKLALIFAIMDETATTKQKGEFCDYYGYRLNEVTDWNELAFTTLCEYGLSIDYVWPNTFKGQRAGYLRYQISWGGPSDEFRFYFVPGEYKPYKIEYWFMDWFDGAKVTCTNGEIANRLWDWLESADTPRSLYNKAMEENEEQY
jgi:hypothetical protein